MLTIRAVLTAVAISTTASASYGESRIIQVSDSPLEITRFSARYAPGAGNYPRDEILMQATLKNVSGQAVTAYSLGLLAFDVFNEMLGNGLRGIDVRTIAADQEAEGGWSYQPLAAFTFKSHGTGVAYVNQVRLADGTVWKADLSEVLREMQKIKDSMTLEDLSLGEK